MLHLKPPAHSVPDNVWHTFLIALTASFFVWQTGQDVIELFMTDTPVTALEQGLSAGEGHPFQLWVHSLEMENFPFLWNRILSTTGWFFSLAVVLKIMKSQTVFVGALPSVILLFTFPGLSLWMSSAGSGSWGIYFFLKAFKAVNENETKAPLIRGGVMAAFAVLVQPIWLLPSLGVLIGCWDAFRYRLKWVAAGFGVALITGVFIYLLFVGNGTGYLLAGPAVSTLTDLPVGLLLLRHLLLVMILLLLLAYGAMRRGVGWWTLALSLPLLILEPLLASGVETLLLPLLLLAALGLVKAPAMLDVRFPRAYQTVLLCQLLLWMPVYLDLRPIFLYSPLP